MKLKTVIADDEASGRSLLQQYLQSSPQIDLIAECVNGKEAVAVINREKPELVFLDIQMPGLTGFQVLERLSYQPQVVFSTAYDQFALQAFEVAAVDYLLKPYDGKAVERAIQRALKPFQDYENHLQKSDSKAVRTAHKPELAHSLLVKKGDILIPLKVGHIIRIQAMRDYSEIVCAKEVYFCSKGIGALHTRLDANHFLRVHRSSIIALDSVDHIKKDYLGRYIVHMTNGDTVRVSRSYTAQIKNLEV